MSEQIKNDSASEPISTSTPNEQSAAATPMAVDATANVTKEQTPEAKSATNSVNVSLRKKKVEKPVAKKVVPAKKTATTPKSTTKVAHPPFFEMITEAIAKLNERSGSSRQAILKFIVSNFMVEEKSGNQHIKVGLKNAVKAGTLKQVKGVGASGSFKLSDSFKSKSTKKSVSSAKKQTKATKKPVNKVKKVTAAVAAKKITSTGKPQKTVATKAKRNLKKTTKPAVSKQATKTKTVTKAAAKSKTKSSPTLKRKSVAVKSVPVVKKTSTRVARK